ncbi:hypothetical protein OESDEN_22079 [Oesophagostomum dentatum]|uniref:Tc1-like transposase DDE domain-containing protein n=1 Tax=Oesophagostomum dentatum TaxID=61180 RepID=A0A0B1S335_OESDE|nr:hypothetical protein OESDEN_22079 [Oesophagostomum dentatum]
MKFVATTEGPHTISEPPPKLRRLREMGAFRIKDNLFGRKKVQSGWSGWKLKLLVRPAEGPHLPQPTQFRRRFTGGVGAFCSGHKLHLAFVSCRMDSEEYQNVLREHLLPFLRGRGLQKYTFQQDNAAVHTSGFTRTWLQDNHIRVLDWPARSPDLKPMENLWGILVRRI